MIAKQKRPMDPLAPMDLEMSIGILFVHSIQWVDKWNVHWTFAFSVGQLTMSLNDVMTSMTDFSFCAASTLPQVVSSDIWTEI
jgi:hypothetical protein